MSLVVKIASAQKNTFTISCLIYVRNSRPLKCHLISSLASNQHVQNLSHNRYLIESHLWLSVFIFGTMIPHFKIYFVLQHLICLSAISSQIHLLSSDAMILSHQIQLVSFLKNELKKSVPLEHLHQLLVLKPLIISWYKPKLVIISILEYLFPFIYVFSHSQN